MSLPFLFIAMNSAAFSLVGSDAMIRKYMSELLRRKMASFCGLSSFFSTVALAVSGSGSAIVNCMSGFMSLTNSGSVLGAVRVVAIPAKSGAFSMTGVDIVMPSPTSSIMDAAILNTPLNDSRLFRLRLSRFPLSNFPASQWR